MVTPTPTAEEIDQAGQSIQNTQDLVKQASSKFWNDLTTGIFAGKGNKTIPYDFQTSPLLQGDFLRYLSLKNRKP